VLIEPTLDAIILLTREEMSDMRNSVWNSFSSARTAVRDIAHGLRQVVGALKNVIYCVESFERGNAITISRVFFALTFIRKQFDFLTTSSNYFVAEFSQLFLTTFTATPVTKNQQIDKRFSPRFPDIPLKFTVAALLDPKEAPFLLSESLKKGADENSQSRGTN